MMEYRKLPRGDEHEAFSVLGLGMGGIQKSSDAEIEAVVRKAIDHGINYFDLCGGAKNIYAPVGKALKGQREKVFIQVHLGAVYNQNGDYGWSRKFSEMKDTFLWDLKTLGTDYTDFGFLHCVDEVSDFEELQKIGALRYLQQLKEEGVVRHIGFSSHTPEVAEKMLDTGLFDLFMFSLNPAYDFAEGDYGERAALFNRAAREGVGISVMKPFHAGKLLSAKDSPFHEALTHYQCLQYALDRPGVLTVLPGVRGMADLDTLLGFIDAPDSEKDYAAINGFTAAAVQGSCVYCGHCKPCPVGLDIGLINKYYDLARAGDPMAASHYDKLEKKASACIGCGHCDSRCPFHVAQSARMQEIAGYFGA